MTIKEILSEDEAKVRLNEYILLKIFVALHADKHWVTVSHILQFIDAALPWTVANNTMRGQLTRAVAKGLLISRRVEDRTAPNAGTRGKPALEYVMADLGRERFRRIEMDRAAILELTPPTIRLARAAGIGPRDRGPTEAIIRPQVARSISYG